MKLLVTSREPLHVRIEHVYSVPPLGLPPTVRHRVTAAELEPIESIQLFVDRARAVRPDFNVTDDNAAAVAEICRRLDGLPLAIELAAARLRLFSPEALRDRLGSRLELLRSTTRDVPERQQTLRATIEWSYALLEPAEQRVFERLAVFADADIGAVESVGAARPPKPPRPPPPSPSTSSKRSPRSSRRASSARSTSPMASPACACSRPSANTRPSSSTADPRRPPSAWPTPPTTPTSRRTLKDELTSGDRDRALAATKAEVGNLRIAWRYWVAQSELGRLGNLAGSLLTLNEARGWYQDTVELTTDMLAVLARTSATPAYIGKEITLRLTLARALIATRGFTPEGVDAYTQALELFERGQSAEGQHYSVLRGLANLYMLRSEFDKAAEVGDQILALAEAEADARMQVDGHLVVGSTMAFTGQLRDGLAHLDTAIGLFKADLGGPHGARVGNDPRVACLTTSAFCLWTMGFPDRAVERTDAAIALSDQLGHPYTSAYARFHSGFLHLWRREPELVLDRAIRLLEIADEFDFQIWSAIGSCLLGAAQTGLGQLEEGLARSREGLAAYQGIVAPPVFVPMLQFMDAGSRGRAGRPAEALPLMASSIELVGGADSPAMMLPEMLVLRGDLLRDTGATDAAVEAWTQALAAARRIEARMPELRALTRLAGAAEAADRAALLDELRDVYAAFTEGLETADLGDAREVLALP